MIKYNITFVNGHQRFWLYADTDSSLNALIALLLGMKIQDFEIRDKKGYDLINTANGWKRKDQLTKS